ncbi:MAG: alpha-2-macroglobulin family protein, partial [bacterium]|nr:alpha-2-macroglobulin family protein [bacterium]
PEKWKSFTFQDQQKLFSQQRYELGEQTLDENGKHSYSFDIPENLEAPSALRGVISATVLEPGGRGVSAYRSVIIHPYNSYIGLRQATPGYATPNQNTEIQFVLTTTNGELIADRKIEVNFYRVYWHSILKRVTSHGQYRYVSEMVEELLQQFSANSQNQIASFTVKPEDYGKYLVIVRDPVTGASASLSFFASGWGYSPWAMDNPDRVELDLDKPEYVPGQSAKIQIRAPFPGKLLLTVERETIFFQKVVQLPENTASVELEIHEQYKPNVFISAHLIRSTESLERDTPVRAFGVIPLKLNTDSNRLTVDVEVPNQIRPNSQLTVKYRLKNFKGGAPRLTIAAVDEGICQLTAFQTPDPHGFFFGKKRLTVETSDIYSLILPEIESTQSSASGGVVEARRKKHISPVSVTRVKPVAFWSGLLKTDGSGTVKFDIPQFNGTLRVMAVAFAGDRFGNQEKQLFVRDPIVMTPTLPRFVASGDEFVAPVSVYNGTDATSDFEVKLEVDGPMKILNDNRQKVRVKKGKEGLVQFRLKAEKTVGKITFKLIASGNGEKSE